MRAALFAYSRRGCATAQKVNEILQETDCKAYTLAKYIVEGFLPIEKPSRPFYGSIFSSVDAMIFIGSCGIAVREIASHLKSKTEDPAVICIDELGRFVIPILSGHIGGANRLAGRIAEALGATAVVTTATDINGKFAADEWAARQGMAISGMAEAKEVSAAILERNLPLASDYPVSGPLAPGLYSGGEGELGILIR